MTTRQLLADAEATDALGRALARTLPGGGVVFLRGDLGAGKSCLARSMLRELGVEGPIKSPTYTLVERYQLSEGEAAHLDLYRIADAAEIEFLGLDAILPEVRLMLVEWPERAGSGLPAADLELAFEVLPEGREVFISASTVAGESWLAALSKTAALSGSA